MKLVQLLVTSFVEGPEGSCRESLYLVQLAIYDFLFLHCVIVRGFVSDHAAVVCSTAGKTSRIDSLAMLGRWKQSSTNKHMDCGQEGQANQDPCTKEISL